MATYVYETIPKKPGQKPRQFEYVQGMTEPALTKDPKTGELFDFTMFARSEGRFAKHFDQDGKASEAILKGNQERLENWRTLQELAGII